MVVRKSDRMHVEMELERLLGEHTKGRVVTTGITCRHGLSKIGLQLVYMHAGRRSLQCADVEDPCDLSTSIKPLRP
uniref:Uncharacterized protein n=1 Tax=Setaria viridis TaxID=4556 RepID=A0A4U6UAL6_SETVI|nr:hypothetical protein SEVIR_6G204000v2 [Setaria viridis]